MKSKILIFCALLISVLSNAQDLHFSQYSATQPYINPALTGFFDGDYRILGNFRMQSKFANSPFMTYGGQADVSLFKNKLGTWLINAAVDMEVSFCLKNITDVILSVITSSSLSLKM